MNNPTSWLWRMALRSNSLAPASNFSVTRSEQEILTGLANEQSISLLTLKLALSSPSLASASDFSVTRSEQEILTGLANEQSISWLWRLTLSSPSLALASDFSVTRPEPGYEVLIWIRIYRSVPLDYGSSSGSCFFFSGFQDANRK